MKKKNVIRAWRDPKYRQSLSEDEKAQLPTHPAAWVDDEVLASVTGGCCPDGNDTSSLCTPCPPRHCF